MMHAALLQADDEERRAEGGRGKRAAEKHANRQAKRARLEAAQGKPRRQVGACAPPVCRHDPAARGLMSLVK